MFSVVSPSSTSEPLRLQAGSGLQAFFFFAFPFESGIFALREAKFTEQKNVGVSLCSLLIREGRFCLFISSSSCSCRQTIAEV